MLIQSLRPQKFSQVVGNQLNNKILMALAKNPNNGPSTILLQGHFGSGKAIDVDSIIPTPYGDKRAGDIQVGDYLFDRTGKPTQVSAVFPQGMMDSYKVTFEDGRIVYCNTEHNWTYINRKTGGYETKTLQEIMDDMENKHTVFCIPINEPVEYIDVPHPEPENNNSDMNNDIDFNVDANTDDSEDDGEHEEEEIVSPVFSPYVMGLLLCNYELKDKGTVLYPNRKSKYIFQLIKETPDYWWDILTDKDYRFPRKTNGDIVSTKEFFGDLYNEIIKEGIIPYKYLYGSVEDRWELLQGIMDTCATISNDNNVFCYIRSESLKNSFITLAHSLGLVITQATYKEPYSFYFKTDRTIIKNLFKNKKISEVPFNRKINKIDAISILSIEKEEEQRDMVCFLVDNDDHLFLCNDYIVTHNTTSARLFAKALNCKNLGNTDICGKCDNCKADLNCVPWYNEFDSSVLNTDSIRDMRDIFMSTARGYNKVIVLDEIHLLSRTALSALLKVFEETPKGIFFLLATTDPDKILPTIRSRSLELTFTTKTQDEVKEDIKKHALEMSITLSESALDIISIRSKGIMRNAHMLLDKFILLGEEEFIKSEVSTSTLLTEYLVALVKYDKEEVCRVVSELSRIPVAYLKEDWQSYFLNLVKCSIDLSYTEDERIKKIITKLGKQWVIQITMLCTQDWVISSFQSSIQAQTALLAIFQNYNKNN